MKDKFGHIKPVQIMTQEWWFNGHIIQRQEHPDLPEWISFPDTASQSPVTAHENKGEAIKFALKNPVEAKDLQNYAEDYL